jgi:hypothetical protein
MKIVLATPLYPPDIAEPAPYIKELAKRLAKTDEVTIVTYGNIPEEVSGVRILTVSKQRFLPFRLMAYTAVLLKAVHGAHIFYTQNGPSVELPALIVSFLTRAKRVVRLGDETAHRHARSHPLLRMLESSVRRRARTIITDSPGSRPEVLPFAAYPTAAFEAFEHSWNEHVSNLLNLFRHA